MSASLQSAQPSASTADYSSVGTAVPDHGPPASATSSACATGATHSLPLYARPDTARPDAVQAAQANGTPLAQAACYSSYRDLRVRLQSVALQHGTHLPQATIALRHYGQSGPLYVVLGGISSHRTLCDEHEGTRGWWHDYVGPGKVLDTRHCQVLGVDFLGSGASTKPRHLGEWVVSPQDQAQVIVRALQSLDWLGKRRVDGLIGSSYGGMVALHWAQRFPHTLRRALVLCAAHRSSPTTSAYRSVQRQIVRLAHELGDGKQGLQLARALAMLGFRTPQELDQRFSQSAKVKQQQVHVAMDDYLNARGHAYVQQHAANSFYCLSQSCDLHQLDPANINTELWLGACPEDQIIPFADATQLAERAAHLRYFQRIPSRFGHDCFIKETQAIRHILRLFTHQQLNATQL